MGLIPTSILIAPLLAIATWRTRQVEERPVTEQEYELLPKSPSGKGWYGVQPSLWDWVFLLVIVSFMVLGMLVTLAAAVFIKQKILNNIFLSQGDLVVVGYGLGTIAAALPGGILGSGAGDIVTELLLRLLIKATGKTKQLLIPAIYAQTDGWGLVGEDLRRWRKIIYGKVGTALLIVALLGAMGGYTRLTESEFIHCGWPGFTEKRYTYDEIVYIWAAEGKSKGKTIHYYAVEPYDGWLWKTTLLNPDFTIDRPKLTGKTNEEYIIALLLEKTKLPLTQGETY